MPWQPDNVYKDFGYLFQKGIIISKLKMNIVDG